MAEALGVAASIIGASGVLKQLGKTLRQSNLEIREGGSPRLKTLILKLEIEIARATFIQGSITSLDVSSSIIQSCLRLFEFVVHRLTTLAEETTNHLRKTSKSRLRSVMLESNLPKQERELEEIRRLLDTVQHALPLGSAPPVHTSSTSLPGEFNSLWNPQWSHSNAEMHWDHSLPKSRIRQKSIVHEHGLRILSDPTDDAGVKSFSATTNDIDIIFIHGLDSSSSSTWRAVDMFWPKDLLPADFPRARVMTFDYDSRVSVSSPLLANNLSTEKALVDILVAARRSSEQKILFCAHSFGGILLQKAVAYCCRTRRSEQSSRDFLASLEGFVFLGTPYLGTRSMSIQSFIGKLIPSAPPTLLDSLAPSIESTVKDLDVFHDFVRNEKRPIYSFYESQPTTTPGGPVKICIPDHDFNRSDASFLSGNHNTMCKFQTAEDSGYRKVVEAMGNVIGATQNRHMSPQRLSRRGIDHINRIQPLKPDPQRFAASQSLMQVAQQDYSEQLRLFLFRLRSRIPPKRSWSDRLSGSCDWILETDPFKQWRSPRGSIFLILRGSSGSGRTKIAQYLVDYLRGTKSDGEARIKESRRVTLSYFCDWTLPARDQAFTYLYELLLQLLESTSSFFREIYLKTDSPPTTYSDLEALVLRLLQTSSIREINIVIDGLDECKTDSLRQIQKTIDQLPGLQLPGRKLRVLITTSTSEVIPSTALQHSTELSLSLFKEERNKNIEAFIKERLMDSTNKKSYSGQLVMQISEGLFQKALLTSPSEDNSSIHGTQKDLSGGNFIWISSAIAVIANGRSAGQMKNALNSLPSEVGPLYDRRLRRIPADDREFVGRALHFIRCSFRSLETKALAFALAIKTHHKTMREVFEEQTLDLQDVLVTFTGDLVVFNNDCVSFAHQTFSKYLDQTASGDLKSLPPLSIAKIHAELATSCLRCLMLDQVMEDDAVPLSATTINEEVWTISFLPYAESYWFEHFKRASSSPELMRLMTSFFSSPKLELWLATRRDAQPELLLPQSSSAHHILAALELFNSQEVLEQLPWPISDHPDEHAGPDQRDSAGMTALHYAIANNALRSIRFLEEKGSDIAATDDTGRSCLHFAVYSGNLELIKQFIGKPPIHPSLLSLAIERRNGDVVDFLAKLTPTSQSAEEDWTKWKEPKTGQGIIHQAVLSRRSSIVEMVLDKGMDLSLTDNQGRTALHWAAKIAERSIIEVLIDHFHSNLPLDTKDNAGNTALHLATSAGDIEIVKMLAEHGADLEIVNKTEQVPLHFAAMYGYEGIVNFLLDEGSPVNTSSNHASPLHMAAAWGWRVVASRLIRDGAAINCKDEKGRSPLYLAAYNGSEVMAKLLVSFGAEVDACDLEGRTPLHVAALGGWTPVVTLLLNAGAKVHAKDNEKNQTLHFAAASKNPSSELVERLIDAGAGLEQENIKGMTAYACAKESGNTLIAELLDRFGKTQDTAAREKSGHGLQVSSMPPESASRLDLLREAESREELERRKIFASIGGDNFQDD